MKQLEGQHKRPLTSSSRRCRRHCWRLHKACNRKQDTFQLRCINYDSPIAKIHPRTDNTTPVCNGTLGISMHLKLVILYQAFVKPKRRLLDVYQIAIL